MKKFFGEFRGFVLRGNVFNLAIGVIIGAAFQNVVTSLTSNILSPLLGLFTGMSFDSWHISLLGVEIGYGAFVTSIFNFVILAFVVFLLVKFVNRIMAIGKPAEAPAAPVTRVCPYCTNDISKKATRCPFCTSEVALVE